jgi:hypothetical protein
MTNKKNINILKKILAFLKKIDFQIDQSNIVFGTDRYKQEFNLLNKMYPSYNNQLYPILRSYQNDDYICYFEEKLLIIHAWANSPWELDGEFSSIEELYKSYISKNKL